MFSYCNNNPVIACDPSGTIAITTLILIGSAILAVGAGGYTGYSMRKNGSDWGDTIFHSIGTAICAFGTAYTLGMSAYGVYQTYCNLNGITPKTHIGQASSPSTNGTSAVGVTPYTQDPAYNLDGAKKLDYITKRGWSDSMINDAIANGRQGSSINMANGAQCTAYSYPGYDNQYVVIENESRSVVQVSNFLDSGWIPDARISWK